MNMDGRNRDERIGQGRERVVDYSVNFIDRTGLIGQDPVVTANLVKIVRCLGEGNLIPEEFYRNGIERDRDDLLQDYGIKHLHLHEDTNIDALLFLVEYRDFVLFLEIDGHRRHFNKPPGAVLRSLHSSSIRNADAKSQRLAAAKLATAKAGLLPRKK